MTAIYQNEVWGLPWLLVDPRKCIERFTWLCASPRAEATAAVKAVSKAVMASGCAVSWV